MTDRSAIASLKLEGLALAGGGGRAIRPVAVYVCLNSKDVNQTAAAATASHLALGRAIAGFRLKTAVKSSGSIDGGGVRFDPMLRGNLTKCA